MLTTTLIVAIMLTQNPKMFAFDHCIVEENNCQKNPDELVKKYTQSTQASTKTMRLGVCKTTYHLQYLHLSTWFHHNHFLNRYLLHSNPILSKQRALLHFGKVFRQDQNVDLDVAKGVPKHPKGFCRSCREWEVSSLKIRIVGQQGPNPLGKLGNIHETLIYNPLEAFILWVISTSFDSSHKKIIHPFFKIEVQAIRSFICNPSFPWYFICTT